MRPLPLAFGFEFLPNTKSKLTPEETTGFSLVEFQSQPSPKPSDNLEGDHRLQPCGASISAYSRAKDYRQDSSILFLKS